jgi:predicted TIM-barrel fold metal-dependent hydrolase
MKIFIITVISIIVTISTYAQAPVMDFEKYDPESTLVVPTHEVKSAKFPFIDVHNHQFNMINQDLDALVKEMDELNMAVMVNLSGRSQEYLSNAVEKVKAQTPGRFILFCNISFDNIGKKGWTEDAVKQLEEDVQNGANGLKIYKSLGLNITDAAGQRVAVNDERLDPIWAKCGELGIPVLIHSADPKPFWDPHDEKNERWLELKVRPRRKRDVNNPAPWQQIINEQHNVFRKHPNTTFINAHMGWMANDLVKLGRHLDIYPNVYVEIGAVIAELGRQPRQANVFFAKYQDRVMFGKDAWNPEEYHTYFRVLETADEYFPYYKKYHAFWRMYGLALPDEILKKLYYKNALRVIPGIDKSLFVE